jgi:hypothetical protein
MSTIAAQNCAHNLVPVSSGFAPQPSFPRLVPFIFSIFFFSSLFPFLSRSRCAFESLHPTNLTAYALNGLIAFFVRIVRVSSAAVSRESIETV